MGKALVQPLKQPVPPASPLQTSSKLPGQPLNQPTPAETPNKALAKPLKSAPPTAPLQTLSKPSGQPQRQPDPAEIPSKTLAQPLKQPALRQEVLFQLYDFMRILFRLYHIKYKVLILGLRIS